ncbi:hypothetical protein [Sphingobium sp. B2]|uniref:hypothetical protein n=1 Tax=Sphingobium sp. B2 TaxID=2583228 RepID=UPI0011A1D049|nr:hypothetical protein [Sphingobium sp. B2]
MKAMLKAACVAYDVIALEDGQERPQRISPFGTVFMRDGDPGEPDIDLSPPTYHYNQRIPIEIAAYKSSEPLRLVLDRMAGAIGAAVAADRFLGGAVDYLDVTAMELTGLSASAPGAQTQMGGMFEIVASYHTTNPLI